MKKLLIIALLVGFVLVSGCAQVPQPSDGAYQTYVVCPDGTLIPSSLSCSPEHLGLPADQIKSESTLLLIGSSSEEVVEFLTRHPELVQATQVTDAFQEGLAEEITNYDIVMLDQSEQGSKTIPLGLAENIEEWVNRGGKLIIVKDSAVMVQERPQIVGWEGTLGEAAPVRCNRVTDSLPSCLSSQHIVGAIFRLDEGHKIMQGLERVPEDPLALAIFDTFDVTPAGNEIAYIQAPGDARRYPAIIEKITGEGRSIYFNFNPGQFPTIMRNALEYLKST